MMCHFTNEQQRRNINSQQNKDSIVIEVLKFNVKRTPKTRLRNIWHSTQIRVLITTNYSQLGMCRPYAAAPTARFVQPAYNYMYRPIAKNFYLKTEHYCHYI